MICWRPTFVSILSCLTFNDLRVPFQCKENGGNIDTFIWQSDGRHVPLGKQQWNNLEVRIRKVGQAWSECGPVLEQQTLARLLRLSGTPCMQTDRVNGGAEDVVVFWISYTWQLSVKCWSWIVMTRLSNRLHTVTWRASRLPLTVWCKWEESEQRTVWIIMVVWARSYWEGQRKRRRKRKKKRREMGFCLM